MKYIINVIIGLLTVLSSCLGAKIATEHELQTPENQLRIIRAKTIKDSLSNTHSGYKIDSRDTTIFIACSDQFTKKITYSSEIQWSFGDDERILVYGTKDDHDFYIANIRGKNCSLSRSPM